MIKENMNMNVQGLEALCEELFCDAYALEYDEELDVCTLSVSKVMTKQLRALTDNFRILRIVPECDNLKLFIR